MKMTQELLRNLIREELSKNQPADDRGNEPSGEREGMTSSDFRRYLIDDFVPSLSSAKNLTDTERTTMVQALKTLFAGAQKVDISNHPLVLRGLEFIKTALKTKTAGALSEQEEVCEKCGKSPCECDETKESIEQAISANKNDVTITRFKENKEDLDELIKEIILSTITNK